MAQFEKFVLLPKTLQLVLCKMTKPAGKLHYLNPLPQGRNIDLSKVKALPDDNCYVAQMMGFLFHGAENIVG